MGERAEAWMRIVVLVVSGIILGLWKALVQILALVNWLITVFTGKRHKGIAEFCEIWNTQVYTFMRYLAFVTNRRPFPFSKLEKNMTKFGK